MIDGKFSHHIKDFEFVNPPVKYISQKFKSQIDHKLQFILFLEKNIWPKVWFPCVRKFFSPKQGAILLIIIIINNYNYK